MIPIPKAVKIWKENSSPLRGNSNFADLFFSFTFFFSAIENVFVGKRNCTAIQYQVMFHNMFDDKLRGLSYTNTKCCPFHYCWFFFSHVRNHVWHDCAPPGHSQYMSWERPAIAPTVASFSRVFSRSEGCALALDRFVCSSRFNHTKSVRFGI